MQPCAHTAVQAGCHGGPRRKSQHAAATIIITPFLFPTRNTMFTLIASACERANVSNCMCKVCKLKDQKGRDQALVDVCNWVKAGLHNRCDKWPINLDFSVIQIKKISL